MLIGSACGAHRESTQWATAFSPDATLTLHGQRDGQTCVVDHRSGQDPVVDAGGLPTLFGDSPDGRGLGSGVGGRNGDDRQAGRERDRLGEARRRSPSDTHQGVDGIGGSGVPGALGHGQRHVTDDLIVEDRHRQLSGDLPGEPDAVRARDHHDPLRAQGLHLSGDAVRRLARGEPHPLAQRLVHEAHRHLPT